MPKNSAPKSSRRPRRPEPFFRTQTRSWYVQIRGRQIPLGSDRKAAWEKYDELIAVSNFSFLHEPVAKLLDAFLEHVHVNRAGATYLWYRHYLRSFVRSIGRTIRVVDLKPLHASQWLDTSFGRLGPTSRNCAIRAVKAAFNWAVDQESIPLNPLRALKRPKAKRREMVLTAKEFQQLILVRCTDQAERDLMLFLWETGARVQEVRQIAIDHVDLTNDRIVLSPSEDKTDQYRVIYLTPVAREIVVRLTHVHVNGLLFRNRRGRPWTSNSIRCRFRKFHVRGLCGTVLRHSFCQRLLVSGVDSITVGILMGHRDLTMVARVYSHLALNSVYLKQQLNQGATSDGVLTA